MALEMASVSLPFDGFMADYDFAIIGGGLNGVSLARDAAGRGLRVILLEQGDLGGAASSATPRLIHGDLSVLERRGFRRVRRALAERRTWLRIAPHLVRPMRFVIPAHSDERPPWLLRAGLFLYDSLTSRSGLPAAATLDITHHPVGNALKRPFGTAEVRYLVTHEWARFPEDILWRRSKLGLTTSAEERDALANFMAMAM